MNIILNISEIAIITGDNKFKTKRDYLIDVWKKNAKDDYEKYKKLTEFIKETDSDIINKISIKNNIDISSDLLKCTKSKNTADLNTMKKSIEDKVIKEITDKKKIEADREIKAIINSGDLKDLEIKKKEIIQKMEKSINEDKKEILESVKNLTNTKFGIKNETDVCKIYESLTGSKIIKDNKYRKLEICKINEFTVYIGGKIDGFNEENQSLIEIKNRVNKLFYALRSYEKVQLMCYLYLFTCQKGHLVEAYKKKDETDINIIEVDFDKLYMDSILAKIELFCKYYIKFLENHEAKINLLKNNDDINFL
jgi:hypothetical protein